MFLRAVACLFLGLPLLARGVEKPGLGQAENGLVEITATAYTGKDLVKSVIGNDLGGFIIVVEVRVLPKAGKPLKIERDDFLLRSDKDGQRAQPFQASQIAGRGVLVVSETSVGGGMMGDSNGPIYGGGPVPMGQPGRMGGNGGTMGSAGDATAAEASIDSGKSAKESPLLKTLKQKILPEKEIKEPLSGLLYFPIEGKVKPKDLELTYRTAEGKISIRFR
jgi:hypothetical protein